MRRRTCKFRNPHPMFSGHIKYFFSSAQLQYYPIDRSNNKKNCTMRVVRDARQKFLFFASSSMHNTHTRIELRTTVLREPSFFFSKRSSFIAAIWRTTSIYRLFTFLFFHVYSIRFHRAFWPKLCNILSHVFELNTKNSIGKRDAKKQRLAWAKTRVRLVAVAWRRLGMHTAQANAVRKIAFQNCVLQNEKKLVKAFLISVFFLAWNRISVFDTKSLQEINKSRSRHHNLVFSLYCIWSHLDCRLYCIKELNRMFCAVFQYPSLTLSLPLGPDDVIASFRPKMFTLNFTTDTRIECA